MHHLFIYKGQKSEGNFTINNYLLCEIVGASKALEVALLLNCEYVRIFRVNENINTWINNGSIMIESPEWYCPDTIKNS